MLEKGLWKFALRTSELTADPDIDTSFGLPYAYVIPDDFVRLAGISTDDRFTNEDESYIEENGKWYSEHSRLYVRYVSNDNAYGFDLGKYPENYCSAFGAFMALRTALPITKDRGDRNDLVQLSEELLQTAKRLDAVDERVKRKPAGRWTRARGISTGPHFAGGRMGWRG
jgi:hypothetical protein